MNYYYSSYKKYIGQGIPVYLMIFIVCQVYQIGIAWDAVSITITIIIINTVRNNTK